MRKRTMSKAGKITAAISGAFLLLIVVAIILIATFDWNRLKPTINQKVSAELNRFNYLIHKIIIIRRRTAAPHSCRSATIDR